MHKSPDGERVCGRCGALLLTVSERRNVVRRQAEASRRADTEAGRRADTEASRRADSENGSGSGAAPTVVKAGNSVATDDKTASAIAIREALEYLGSSAEAERRSTPDRRSSSDRRSTGEKRAVAGGGSTPGRKVNRGWLITIGLTLLVAIGLGLFLGLGSGSSASAPGGSTPSSATATTTSLFQFDGSGPSTTGPFTTTGAFTFSYTLTCPEDLATPAIFELIRAGRSIGDVASGVGTLQESGNQPDFGTSGTFTVSVDAPATCAWTVSGDT